MILRVQDISILIISIAITLSCSPSFHCVDVNNNEWDFKEPGLQTYILNGDTQIPILAREPLYQAFEQFIYYDNLDSRIGAIPEDAYTNKLTSRKRLFILQLFHIDSEIKELFIYTPKARSGYLHINKNISRLYHAEMGLQQIDTLNYYVNDTLVSKRKDWTRLIMLEETDMRLDSLNFSVDGRTINAHINVTE